MPGHRDSQLAALHVAALQQLADRAVERDQRRAAARFDDRQVEGEIGRAALDRIVQRVHQPRQLRADALQVALARPLAGKPDRLALDGDARLHHVVEDVGLLGEAEGEEIRQNRDVGLAHIGALAVADIEEAEHGQRAQRFAQQRPGYAQRQRELAFAQQAISGLQRAAKELLAKEGKDLLYSQMLVHLLC